MKKNLLTSGIVNPFSPSLCREKMYVKMKKIIMALIAVMLVFSLLPPVRRGRVDRSRAYGGTGSGIV